MWSACSACWRRLCRAAGRPDLARTPVWHRARETGGMGGGIGQWLLFRSADHSLTVFSLVVLTGSSTPVHDHHAWGLVGLYRGQQAEDVYRRDTVAPDPDGRAPLTLTETRVVEPGNMYRLLPPSDDVHSVRTTSTEASVSIHLLGIDIYGCVWRHRFEPDHARATRSDLDIPTNRARTTAPSLRSGSPAPERRSLAASKRGVRHFLDHLVDGEAGGARQRTRRRTFPCVSC